MTPRTLLCRADLYAREYQRAIAWPTGAFMERPLRSTEDARAIARQIIKQKIEAGVLRKPSGLPSEEG
jgi:hypothetical protein